ncbi:sigma-70 family RNA polymerase sigma factor [Nocardia arthritidis]|uniref:Sigma-70 family RNA polymerase sigma factor n=1 Tax=Nocardia arthritidis TaxID=228602 RepID=A0A6G9YAR5_9NOCA|nr:sigma-70 family RNA polymerase sigma factor [Nocardia arthritidis]QIS10302.1 sigma-70 family RNA polymerase sigma factor [Nocardia arthritidis]
MVSRTRAVPTAAPLERLLGRVACGDEHAFAELYDAIAGPVLAIVTRILHDRDLAEEVAQEVLLEVWLKANRFGEADGGALAWVLTIAHQRAVDRVRYEHARDRRTGQRFDEAGTLDELAHDPVSAALNQLTEPQRRSLILAYYGGYTDHEVSTALAESVTVVRSNMRDGLITLRDMEVRA